ncbi:cell division protein FtsX [Thermosulfuriphilus sp.]
MGLRLIVGKALFSFKRRPWSHLAATTIIFLQLSIFAMGLFFYHNLRQATEILGQELSLTVFLKDRSTEEDAQRLAEEILSWPEVASVRYVSPEEALERIREAFSQNSEILSGLAPDFLPPSLEIYFWQPFGLKEKLPTLARTLSGYPQVEEVRYAGDWLARLQGFSELLRRLLALVAAVLVFTVAFVVSNIIRINVYSRREELEILRLVGASPTILKGPFLIEALIQAVLASGLAVAALYLLFIWLKKELPATIFGHPFTLHYLPWPWLASLMGGMVLVCLLASFIPLRRLLKE